MYTCLSLLHLLTLSWWHHDPIYAREKAAYNALKLPERQGRPHRRTAHRTLYARHYAMARQYAKVSFWLYLRYLHNAPTGSLPAFNRYVTLAERQMQKLPGATDQRDHLLSPTLEAPRLPVLPGAQSRQ